jgi:hypothetical protein
LSAGSQAFLGNARTYRNWRELVLSELIRRAEEINADAIIGFDYETEGITPIEETGLQLQRILDNRSKSSVMWWKSVMNRSFFRNDQP